MGNGFLGWLAGGEDPSASPDGGLAVLVAAPGVLSREYRGGRTLTGARCQSGFVDGVFAVVHGTPRWISDGAHARSGDGGIMAQLIDAARAEGAGAFRHLSGAFAVALVFAQERRVLLATDRLGMVPLFHAARGGTLAFATDLRRLLACGILAPVVDPQSIYDYSFFAMIPAPRTAFLGYERLTPGTALEWRAGSGALRSYWRAHYDNETGSLPGPRAEVERDFRDRLRAGVARQTGASGARIGCFLSGGTDSSTVAGMLREVTGEAPRTYSIGFDEPGFDEMEFARCAARHFAADHHEYYVTSADVRAVIDEIAAEYGEPFGNSSAVPTLLCARLARQDGVTRLLGGDGGDELFGGNEIYRTSALFARYHLLPGGLRRNFIEPLVSLLSLRGRVPVAGKAWRYIEQASMPMPERLRSYSFLLTLGAARMFDADFLGSVERTHPLDLMRRSYDGADARTMLNRVLAMDLKFILADNDLRKVSGMCELAGVEAGFPLLDDGLVEFAARLPADEKVRGLKLRYFFKRALADFLPRKIIAKQKHGFGLPFGQWLGKDRELKELAFDSLGSLAGRGIFSTAFLDELRGPLYQEDCGHYGKLIWVLMLLERWYVAHERSVAELRDSRRTGRRLSAG
jgi:asparagine synthase (glutamine-hydrolysing)